MQLEPQAREHIQESDKAADQLATLYHLGQKLVLPQDAKEIAQLVVDAVRQILRVPTCGLWLVDRERKNAARWAHAAGVDAPEIPPFPLDSAQGVIVAVIRSGETIYLPDVQQDPRYCEANFQAHSELCVPLRVGGQVIGALNAESELQDGFGSADRRLLEVWANSSSSAINNARLYKEAYKRTERQALVNRIAKVTSATLDMRSLVETMCQEVISAFQAEAFFAALYDEGAGEIQVLFAVDQGVRQSMKQVPFGGLTSIVVKEKRPLIIQNLGEEQDYLSKAILMGDRHVASWMGAPLLIGERVIGLISVQAYHPNAWGKDDELLLCTVADQIAVALETARSFQERERRVTELAILNEIGRAIASTLKMDELLETVYQQVSRLFDTTNFYIAIYERESDEWVVAFWIKRGQRRPTGQRWPTAVGLTGYIIRNCHYLLFRSSQETLDFQKTHGVESVGSVARSWLGVPLVVADKVVGVMSIQSYEQDDLYDGQDLALFSTVAAQVAPGLDNLRLLEEARRRAEELAVLNELGQALTARLSVEQVLAEAYQGVSHLLDITTFYIGLYDPDKHEIRFVFDVSESEPDSCVTTVSDDQGLAGYIVRNRTSVLISDNLLERQKEMGIEPIGAPARCFLGVPLIVADRVLGAMVVQSYTTPRLYNEHDRDLLTAIANQAAIAIQNAQLYEQAQHEIAERKRAEERLHHYAAELEQSNEEVKRFAYIVSHDLRAPLVNLKGFAAELRITLDKIQNAIGAVLPHVDEQARQDIVCALRDDAPEALGFIDSSVSYMDRFISALLRLSRLGRRELKLEEIDMQALVQAILQTLAHQIAEHQGEVTVEPLPVIVADRTSMEQIMSNILGNAVKYLTYERPAEIAVAAERNEDTVTFRIRDNGRGIAEGDMDTVFTPFRRASDQNIPGEGMGLAYVQALVRRHGGRIWCESKLGVGTTFIFTISNHLDKGDNYV